MRSQYLIFIFITIMAFIIPAVSALGQESHELIWRAVLKNLKDRKKSALPVICVLYSDAKGAKRLDENLVTNFRLSKLFRVEAGLRYGEKPGLFNAYLHYKA